MCFERIKRNSLKPVIGNTQKRGAQHTQSPFNFIQHAVRVRIDGILVHFLTLAP